MAHKMLILRARMPEPVADAVMALFAAIEVIGGRDAEGNPIYNSEDLTYDMGPEEDVKPTKKAGARKHYVPNNLPMKDGAFDMDGIQRGIKRVLENSGNFHGVIYQAIVEAFIEGKQITEPEIRERFSYKAGTCQRVVGDLARGKLITPVDIINKPAEPEVTK